MSARDKWVIAVCITVFSLLIIGATLVISAVIKSVSIPSEFNLWIDAIKDCCFKIRDWFVDAFYYVKDWFTDLFSKSDAVETVAKIK